MLRAPVLPAHRSRRHSPSGATSRYRPNSSNATAGRPPNRSPTEFAAPGRQKTPGRTSWAPRRSTPRCARCSAAKPDGTLQPRRTRRPRGRASRERRATATERTPFQGWRPCSDEFREIHRLPASRPRRGWRGRRRRGRGGSRRAAPGVTVVERDHQLRAVPADRGGDVAAQGGAVLDDAVRVVEELDRRDAHHGRARPLLPLAQRAAPRARGCRCRPRRGSPARRRPHGRRRSRRRSPPSIRIPGRPDAPPRPGRAPVLGHGLELRDRRLGRCPATSA